MVTEIVVKIVFAPSGGELLRAVVECETDVGQGQLAALVLARTTLSLWIKRLQAGLKPDYLTCPQPDLIKLNTTSGKDCDQPG